MPWLDPDPVIFTHPGISEKDGDDIRALAVMHELANTLDSERAKPIQAAIEEVVPRDLPGVRVSFQR